MANTRIIHEKTKGKSDIETALLSSSTLEKALRDHWNAEGDGLGKLASNVQADLPFGVADRLRQLASIRNKAAHEPDNFKLSNKDRFLDEAHDLHLELTQRNKSTLRFIRRILKSKNRGQIVRRESIRAHLLWSLIFFFIWLFVFIGAWPLNLILLILMYTKRLRIKVTLIAMVIANISALILALTDYGPTGHIPKLYTTIAVLISLPLAWYSNRYKS